MPVHVARNTEIYRPDERLPAEDRWMETLAHIMDGAVQIGPLKVGIDPLLGLIPGIGDLMAALVSMVIVLRAVLAGVPRIAIARMLANIAIDTFVGSIPVLGDAFDFAFHSNLKNLRIYQQSLYQRRGSAARHWGFFIALFLVLGAITALAMYGLIALIRAI